MGYLKNQSSRMKSKCMYPTTGKCLEFDESSSQEHSAKNGRVKENGEISVVEAKRNAYGNEETKEEELQGKRIHKVKRKERTMSFSSRFPYRVQGLSNLIFKPFWEEKTVNSK